MTTNTSLAYYGGQPTVPADFVMPTWPVVTSDFDEVITRQLHESISIYNRSGVIEEFEDTFANAHDRKYALLGSSGTNSIWSMMVASGLAPGDEILCPTYTFFATNTPALSCGLTPVFCDADSNGNIDINDMKKRLTSKTRAIILTHMWGYPCDMDAICEFAKEHNLMLFEDCSHAHFATYKDRLVGTFGTAAAWSLQGQKNITGGEGGIILTDDQELYIRANLHGHYNKRCRQVIPEDHELYRFAVTGMGLKMRSHPLAVAFANHQLTHREEYQAMRQKCADSYRELFAQYDFIDELSYAGSKPSWYGYIVKFNAEKAGVSREEFVDLLLAEGLSEVDIPGSTGPNHLLPVFREPSVLFPQFYSKEEKFNTDEEFPGAMAFHNSIIKLPTWTQPEHEKVLNYYLEGLRKVLDYVRETRRAN